MRISKIFDPSGEHLISLAADRAVATILRAWNENRDAHIVVTGGRSGVALCKALDYAFHRSMQSRTQTGDKDSQLKVHIWLSDERFVSALDQDRTGIALSSALSLTADLLVFHQLLTNESHSLSDATSEYAEQLKAAVTGRKFDIALLSMGEDGHVASCFPGQESLESPDDVVSVPNSPKPPKERVTLSLARIALSNQIYILALGEAKRMALTSSLDGVPDMPIEILHQNSSSGQIFILTDLQ